MIKLGEKWAIKSDRYCVTVMERKFNEKEKSYYYKPMYYYQNFGTAVMGLADRAIQDMDLSSLEEIVGVVHKLKNELINEIRNKPAPVKGEPEEV